MLLGFRGQKRFHFICRGVLLDREIARGLQRGKVSNGAEGLWDGPVEVRLGYEGISSSGGVVLVWARGGAGTRLIHSFPFRVRAEHVGGTGGQARLEGVQADVGVGPLALYMARRKSRDLLC